MTGKNLYILMAFAMLILVFSSNVHAAAFESTVTPTSFGMLTSTLLNFTVNNTHATNTITNVNITLPSGFTYIGNPNPATVQQIGGTLVWNTGISIAAGSTQYFSFNITTPSLGNFSFNVSTFDSGAVYNSTLVNVTTKDTFAPAFSNNMTNPTSPATYASNATYFFNITWNDNIGINATIFNWNGVNETVLSSGSGMYTVNRTDLAAGTYTYQWYANDTYSNWNTTGQISYNVSQAPNMISMYLNDNLNQNIFLENGTVLNITIVAKTGTISLYKDNVLISSNPNQLNYLFSSPPLAIGNYVFFANSTGGSNYTANSTGVAQTVSVIYPTPRYSVATSIPANYTSSSATWSATWWDLNDPNGFNVSFIELNYSGTPTNYTMARTSGTNTSSYSVTLPAGAFYWKIYGNNSYNSWNTTAKNTFIVGKAVPSISITILPALQVFNYTQVNVSCSSLSSGVTVSLYKNSTSVANPYATVLPKGYYKFDCNSTATSNYASYFVTGYLSVIDYSIAFGFVDAPTTVSVDVNASKVVPITIKNDGTESQTIHFTIDNLDKSIWSSNAENVTLAGGATGIFLVTFNGGSEIKEYSGTMRAYSTNLTKTSNLAVRVVPGQTERANINILISDLSEKLTRWEGQINGFKIQGIDAKTAEDSFNQFKAMFNQAQGYLSNNDYYNTYFLLEPLKSLMNTTSTEVDKIVKIRNERLFNLLKIVIPIVAVVGVLIYLLLPPSKSNYSKKRGYKYKSKESNFDKASQQWDKLKDKWKKKK